MMSPNEDFAIILAIVFVVAALNGLIFGYIIGQIRADRRLVKWMRGEED